MKKAYPQVSYGAVYYRRSNPPRQDWERDYAQAAADGMNLFRHWFLWSSIEIAPGVFDFEPYDRQMELAAQNGIGTVIAEMQSIPEWLYASHPELCCELVDGTIGYSMPSVSCATGGFVEGGLCLDNDEARLHANRFLTALATRYKGHPGLFGYDVWNECNYSRRACYCEHTQKKFRQWLKNKYGDLKTLGEKWYRYSYTDWDQIQAPRYEGQYPECTDWLAFRKDNFYEQMQWRIDTIHSIDADAHITAHGVAASLDYGYGDGGDDWLAASKVESYGMTWVIARKGSEKWKQWYAIDLLRAASRGKIFWHAEMQGGPLWLQPQVIGRAKEDGRVATPEDVRLWNLVSLAGGARGILYLRWRSLLDGPLFGAFGLYGMDGLPNKRSDMASKIAKWANSEKMAGLFAAKPVKGEIGIIVLQEIQEFNRLIQQAGKGKFYSNCVWGAYQAFQSIGVQADWVHFDDIDEYKTLYFPYPIQLDPPQADKLKAWVEAGGTLISEGLIGYFGDHGRVGVTQPNHGFDKVFGTLEDEVEFMPDLGNQISFTWPGVGRVNGGLFLQSYNVTTGKELARYEDGRVAAVMNVYGKGKAILIGTYPSEAYFRGEGEGVPALYNALLEIAGVAKQVQYKGTGDVMIRLSEGNGKRYLWALNHGKEAAELTISLSCGGKPGTVLWGNEDVIEQKDGFVVTVSGKDAVVLEIL